MCVGDDVLDLLRVAVEVVSQLVGGGRGDGDFYLRTCGDVAVDAHDGLLDAGVYVDEELGVHGGVGALVVVAEDACDAEHLLGLHESGDLGFDDVFDGVA